MFVDACFDDNEQNFPLAFDVLDSKNEASYTWFFERFKEAYDYVNSLAFIIDRHKGLKNAIAKIYLITYHKNYMYNLSCNAKLHFSKKKFVFMSLYKAVKAYLQMDFDNLMTKLLVQNIGAY